MYIKEDIKLIKGMVAGALRNILIPEQKTQTNLFGSRAGGVTDVFIDLRVFPKGFKGKLCKFFVGEGGSSAAVVMGTLFDMGTPIDLFEVHYTPEEGMVLHYSIGNERSKEILVSSAGWVIDPEKDKNIMKLLAYKLESEVSKIRGHAKNKTNKNYNGDSRGK